MTYLRIMFVLILASFSFVSGPVAAKSGAVAGAMPESTMKELLNVVPSSAHSDTVPQSIPKSHKN